MERNIRSYLIPSIFYAILLEVMIAAAILYWPQFQEAIPVYVKVPLQRVSGILATITDIGAYVNLQHFFKACNVLGTAAAVFFAAGAIAGEANRGTLELLLSRPVSRTRLLLERYFAGALALTVPIFVTSATIPYLLEQIEETTSLTGLMLSSVHQSLFLLVLFSLTFCISTVTSRPMPVALGLLFLTIFEFAIYLVMDWYEYSWFRFADPEVFKAIFATGQLDVSTCSFFAATSASLLGASLFLFHRRVP